MNRRIAIATSLAVAGCQGERVQSVLHPAGPAAETIAGLWWFLLAVTGAVFVWVMAALALALLRRRSEQSPLGDRFVLTSGVYIPAVILIAMLVASLETTIALQRQSAGAIGLANPREPALTVRIVGHQWWWEVEYPEHGIITANEVHIPVGQPVRLEVTAGDVIHSVWAPELNGKIDALPDHINRFWLEASRPGTFRGQCAEYCGVQHARMAFYVVALPPEDFDRWLQSRQRPHAEPETDELRRGREVFFEAGCNACHAIAGTEADARTGPDLTHIGSRLSIGAGQWPNNRGNLAGWIVNPQAMKPGNLMPRTFLVKPDDLHALVAYMESLQ